MGARLTAWAAKWLRVVDAGKQERLGGPGAEKAVEEAHAHLSHVHQETGDRLVRRPPPRRTHSLPEYFYDRGEQVESYHSESGDFANCNSRPELAQMLTEVGTVRFNMNRLAKSNYDDHKADDNEVPHHDLCLMYELNASAKAASFPSPYPLLPLLVDRGEYFLHDYYMQQKEREQQYSYQNAKCVHKRDRDRDRDRETERETEREGGSLGSSG